jgi:hypothetical protein
MNTSFNNSGSGIGIGDASSDNSKIANSTILKAIVRVTTSGLRLERRPGSGIWTEYAASSGNSTIDILLISTVTVAVHFIFLLFIQLHILVMVQVLALMIHQWEVLRLRI